MGVGASCGCLSGLLGGAARAGPLERLRPDAPAHRQWMQRMRAFVFDIDGVVHVAGTPVKGAAEALDALRAAGKRVLFVTNNGMKTPDDVVQLFKGFGVSAEPAEVLTSSIATASWLENRGLRSALVYVLGTDALAKELVARAGVRVLGASADAGKSRADVEADFGGRPEPPPSAVAAVVVSADPLLNYYKLARAANYLRSNKDCLFVATNPDPRAPLGTCAILPAAGSIVAAVACAAGRPPDMVCGKPNPGFARYVLESHGLDPRTTCMVGDRTDTDIEFGRSVGMDTLLVESGTMTEAEAASSGPGRQPRFVAHSIAALGDLLRPVAAQPP